MYRRVGVSAFAKRHQLRRDLLVVIAVSKSSLTAHFERNDITIMFETGTID